MKFIILFLFFFSFKTFSIVGHDDRFYIHGTKWADLLNGIVKINNCTGFVIEGDVIVSAAHCLDDIREYDKYGAFQDYHTSIEDSKIDYKNLKHIKTYFGDTNLDKNDKTKTTHFDKMSEAFPAKDLFLGYNQLKNPLASGNKTYYQDYAFVKLKDPIPKKIKRFKLFNSDLLKDYEILKHPDRGNLSTAGFHEDNTKTRLQRMAHIGCKVRDLKKYKRVWLEHSDCDVAHGGSGSPLFYILRHKRSKKIELAVRSINTSSVKPDQLRKLYDNHYIKKSYAKHGFNILEKVTSIRYRLGFSDHYFRSLNYGSYLTSLLITNHKEFLSNLEKFKKDPSFFRNKKILELPYDQYMDERWISKNIVQKKSLKELEKFIKKDLAPLEMNLQSKRGLEISDFLQNIATDKKYKISKEKRKLLKKYFLVSTSTKTAYYYSFIWEKYIRSFYPYKKRAKRFSQKKIKEAEKKFHRKDPDTFENSVKDKIKAQKLWEMYFSK